MATSTNVLAVKTAAQTCLTEALTDQASAGGSGVDFEAATNAALFANAVLALCESELYDRALNQSTEAGI